MKKKTSSHSTFKKGLNDYQDDWGNLTHYLGNDDFPEGNRASDPDEDLKENPRLKGKVAEGNELMEEEDTASPAGKEDEDRSSLTP
jgi:hypothetical protein